MGSDLTVADLDHCAITRDAVDNDPEEGGSGSQESRVRGDLGDVQSDGRVTIDGVCVIELEMSLAHVHRMSGESTPRESDGGATGCCVSGA